MIINEDNFIMHLLNKDEKALSYVIDVYGGLIKSIVSKDLYNLESYKDECINDILLAVWDGIDKYDNNKGSFKYWLAAIAKYKCIGYKRKYLNVKLIEENLDSIELESEDNIQKAMEKAELEKEVFSLLSNLKPKDRDIFIRYYINEEKIQDIAKYNSVKEDVIYNRISRGKKKIRAIFQSR